MALGVVWSAHDLTPDGVCVTPGFGIEYKLPCNYCSHSNSEGVIEVFIIFRNPHNSQDCVDVANKEIPTHVFQ